MKSIVPKNSILILHDIRSEQNVGSLFRTADAAGVATLYISGITPAPIDRFGRAVGTIAKTALGAEKTLAWKKISDLPAELTSLKKAGYQLIAIEQSPSSIHYKKVALKHPVVFIVGNEVEGLPVGILDACDVVAEIPMHGSKESLNVAVAGGIALFGLLDL